MPALLAEQLDHEMGLGGCAGRGVVEFAGLGLGERHEFGQRIGRHLRIDQEQHRILRHHDDGREVALAVVGHAWAGGRNDREARGDHQQGVAVRRRLGGGVGADDAARGRPVVDDERLSHRPLEIRRHQPRHHVVEPAGRERHDQADGTIGIGVGARSAVADGDERHACEQPGTERVCARVSHRMRPHCDYCRRERHAASFSISPMTASPICAVVTILAPSDLMSAVRRPCASAAAIAWSIWSASFAILSE